jgi:hypothetical protein
VRTVRQRFERKFQVTPGCWQWIAGTQKPGYGRFRYLTDSQQAHRVSYLLYVGEIPEGLHVLHKCDNPQCVNPDHLFLGTQADNNADKISKGRSIGPRGEACHMAKLTNEQAVFARTDPRSTTEVAKELGVSYLAVWNIRKRNTWRHV